MHFKDLSAEELQHHRAYKNHEIVRRFQLTDDVVAFIALHNTNLGPGLGGCRFRAYATEDDAIHDVLRLSRGMTYKSALAGLPLGGGKSVIMGDPKTQKTPAVMKAMGRAVETLSGQYITAEDSGTDDDDMAHMAPETRHVTGLPDDLLPVYGSGHVGGYPSPYTAIGIYRGIKAAAAFKYGDPSLEGKTISVQGLGAVGFEVSRHLHTEGAQIIACDVNEHAIQQAKTALPGIKIVHVDDIYGVEADIFSPSAMGGILNDDTIAQLHVDIVAGGANNQLAIPDKHDQMLAERNILYVPDYVINAGGVICVGYEYFDKSGFNPKSFPMTQEAMSAHVEGIGGFVTEVLTYARDNALNPGAAADRLAEEKFMKAS